jgi:hypothetical protein
VPGTQPSHALADYAGEYEHPAYGALTISEKDRGLSFDFHKIRLPLSHFHYDRFETPDDEREGKWSVNFQTNPQGEIDKALMSLDEAEVTFTRRIPAELTAPATLQAYVGKYETPAGVLLQVVLKENGTLGTLSPSGNFRVLKPWKPRQFRIKEFSDTVYEFEVKDGQVVALKRRDPSGERRFPRK